MPSKLSGFLRLTGAECCQTIDEGPLTGKQLFPSFFEREPLGAIDFGKGLPAPAAGRPFHLEMHADQRSRIQLGFHGKGEHPFPAGLAHLTEGL